MTVPGSTRKSQIAFAWRGWAWLTVIPTCSAAASVGIGCSSDKFPVRLHAVPVSDGPFGHDHFIRIWSRARSSISPQRDTWAAAWDATGLLTVPKVRGQLQGLRLSPPSAS
jgi:hypothetical protein